MDSAQYDPFSPARFPVGVRTVQARDASRGRLFPCEIWYPAQMGEADSQRRATFPLIVFSHYSGGHRRSATYLCTHLASHGYVVAAMDHSEVVAKELSRRDGETQMERATRIDAVIASRVPDARFLIDYMLGSGRRIASTDGSLGLVGHSFGGWTVLATPEVEPRVRAVVAMAPGGSSHPKPGILPLKLTFEWGRDVPTLYLAAENDTPIALDGVYELFARTRSSKRMFILRRADHQHFIDDVEREHEALRAMSLSGEAAWIPPAMLPMTELSSGEQAHAFVRACTLAHLDATLRHSDAAKRFLDDDVEAAFAARGVEAFAH